MNCIALLADFAQVADGKLYIMGGGWSTAKFDGPVQMALALRVSVPWDRADEVYQLRVDLRMQDGEQFTVDGKPLEVQAQFQVGRAPGVPKGTDLDAFFAFNIGGFLMSAGAYYWQVHVDEAPVARAPFVVRRSAS